MIVLNESDVYIWCRSTALLDGETFESADRNLSIEERTRRDQLRFEVDRREFTIANDLLRRTLSKYTDFPPADWRFASDGRTKPSIKSTDPRVQGLSFSVSHTRGCVACAIASNAPLGVDVEQINESQRPQDIAERYFSDKEATWLRQCTDEVRNIRFAELWTLKEAFLKAVGVGLAGSLASVSFGFNEHGRIEFSGPSVADRHAWHFALFEPFYNVRLGIAINSAAQPRFFMRRDDREGLTLAPIRASTPARLWNRVNGDVQLCTLM